MSLSGLETIRGLMIPQKADRTILIALKKRLEETEITLTCTNCHYTWDTTIHRAEHQPKCSKCGAIKISVLKHENNPNPHTKRIHTNFQE